MMTRLLSVGPRVKLIVFPFMCGIVLPFQTLANDQTYLDLESVKCAIHSSYLALKYHGKSTTYGAIQEAIPITDKGGKMTDIYKLLRSQQLNVQGVICEMKELKSHQGSFILQLSFRRQDFPAGREHFVFGIYSEKKRRFLLADPSSSSHVIPVSEEKLSTLWTGRALLIN